MKNQNERLERIIGYLIYSGLLSSKSTQRDLSEKINMDYSNISKALKGEGVHPKTLISKINNSFGDIINYDWLLTGKGNMLKNDTQPTQLAKDTSIETRPRIPLNAAAGTVSVALSGITADDSEQLPIIQSFSNYSYTILVKGDSMEPEFHSGDELACLQLTNGKAKFIQWGRYHILDTAQGIVVKRIYEKEEYIICKSENKDLYPDFEIHKDDIYNIGLVIGMLRRF